MEQGRRRVKLLFLDGPHVVGGLCSPGDRVHAREHQAGQRDRDHERRRWLARGQAQGVLSRRNEFDREGTCRPAAAALHIWGEPAAVDRFADKGGSQRLG